MSENQNDPKDNPADNTQPTTTKLEIQQAPFLTQWSGKVTNQLGEGIEMQAAGGLAISQTAQMATLDKALVTLYTAEDRAGHMSVALRLSLGDLIEEIANRTRKSYEEVISDAGFCGQLDLKMRTILKWPQVARQIPAKHRHIGLLWSHYYTACAFAQPDPRDQPVESLEFLAARNALLDEAAKDPERCNKAWLEEQMRNLQQKTKVKKTRPAKKADLFEHAAKLLYIDQNATEEDLDKMGHDRSDVANALQEVTNEMINQGIIDPDNLIWPELEIVKVIEAEVVEAEEESPAE